MNETFDVGNPTKENIDFAFKNLIFYITASTQLDIYTEQKKNFEKVLIEINTILATYVNKESLIPIDEEKLDNIKLNLIDLDTKTRSLKSYYAEWSLLWLEAITSLRMSEFKMEGTNKAYKEMIIHINNILEIIKKNKIGEHLINDICNIKKQIENKKINLDNIKKVSNDIYTLNLNSDFSEVTDRINNEYYAFEYILQEFLKKGDK